MCFPSSFSTFSHTKQDSHSVYVLLTLLSGKDNEGDNNPDYCVAKSQQKNMPAKGT